MQDLRKPTLLDIEHAPPATFFGESNGSLDDVLPQCVGDDGARFPASPLPLPPQSSSPPLEYVDLPPARRRPLQPFEDLTPPVPSLDANGRIPSSSTPSPMKLPPSSDARLTCEPSPVRVPHPRDVARELQESLTTLLGKRQVSEDDILRPEQRKGKRPRPLPRHRVRWQSKVPFFIIFIHSFIICRCNHGKNHARPLLGSLQHDLCCLRSPCIMTR